MNIESFPLGPLMTNAYLIYDEELKKGIVLDPGSEPDELLTCIEDLSLDIEAILLTHAHFDHIGGLEEVRRLTRAPVYLHQEEQDWLTDPEKNGSGLWPGLSPIVCYEADHLLQGSETFTFLNQTFEVLHTPGHSPGSVSYRCGECLFGGDVLFRGSIGRTDLYQGDYATLCQSIQTHFLSLPDSTRVFPGHGPDTTIGTEKEGNPFLERM